MKHPDRRIFRLALVALLAASALPACGGGETSGTSHRTHFQTMESFVEHERKEKSRDRHQVVMIGLDGANWYTIDQLIAKGDLPTFQRLKNEGAWGHLNSVDAHFSPPAWMSMLTGFSPEKMGIYSFGNWDKESNRFRSVNSLDLKRPALWDVVSAAGRKVAVTNIPVTYPARPVNGIMVTGLMTPNMYGNRNPKMMRGNARPMLGTFDAEMDSLSVGQPLQATLQIAHNTTITSAIYDTSDDSTRNYDTIVFRVRQGMQTGPRVRARMGEYSPWFQFTHKDIRAGTEKRVACSVRTSVTITTPRPMVTMEMTPMTRLPNDPELNMTYPEVVGHKLAERFGHYQISFGYNGDIVIPGVAVQAGFCEYFYDYDDWDLFMYVFSVTDNIHHPDGLSERTEEVYRRVDKFLAHMIEKLPPDATLMITSDHGFGPFDRIVGLNEWLVTLGLQTTGPSIRHEKTIAFHQDWCIYFNDDLLTHARLTSRQIPGDESVSPRQRLMAFLQEEALKIVDEQGNPTPIELVPISDDAVGTPPDMFVVGSYPGGYYVEGDDMRIRSTNIVRETTGRLKWFHTRQGIYALWGNRVRPGVAGGPRDIRDITPTALYLLSLPLAEDFDGAVMDDLILESITSERPHYTLAEYDSLTPSADYTVTELESLEDMLKSLGYVN